MKFGTVAIEESLGGIVAHSLHDRGLVLKKGAVISREHVSALRAAGFKTIVAARLEVGDIEENKAALALAQALAGDNLAIEEPATGRVNIFAKCDGVFVADMAVIDQINAIDEGITLATLAPMRAVARGEMVATVKIIPFSVLETVLAGAIEATSTVKLAVAPFRPLRIGVISTLLPGLKMSVVEKTLHVLATRIAISRAQVVADKRVGHNVPELAQAIASIASSSDMIIVFGASAITDRRDMIPAAVEHCGGHIIHFGMPVDPGNLLLLAHLACGTPLLGAPGCARSPKNSGFDWVLQRLLAGVPVSSIDITRMGAGGLLIETGRQLVRSGGVGPKPLRWNMPTPRLLQMVPVK